MCLLSSRHADIPESSVRYVGAMVDDVIKTGSEVSVDVRFKVKRRDSSQHWADGGFVCVSGLYDANCFFVCFFFA